MNDYPRFRPDVQVAPVGQDLVFLLGEQEEFLLRGRIYAQLATLLDGTRSIVSIVEALAAEAPLSEICHALLVLRQKGYLADGDEDMPGAALWRTLGASSSSMTTRERLTQLQVSVTAPAHMDPEPMIRALAAVGLGVVDDGAIEIVLTDDYLAMASDETLAPGRHRMLVRPAVRTIWLGPMLGPRGSCQACLLHRLRENRVVEAFVRRHGNHEGTLRPPPAAFTSSLAIGLHLAAVSVARWISDGGKGALGDHLITLDLAELSMMHHPVIRRPQCTVCGDPGIGVPDASRRPLTLIARPKQHTADGGHRCASPEATYQRLQRHVDPITGFVTRLAPVDSRTHTMTRLWSAAHPVCPTMDQPGFHDFYVASWGKGMTDAQARVSALAEAIERRSAVFRGDEPRIRARYLDLAPRAIPPHAIDLFSEKQYRDHVALNADVRETRRRVPRPFDEQAEIEWTPVWSLTRNDTRYVPTQHCYSQYPVAGEQRYTFFHSNGNAAGSCLEEAILQGFLELVERDCVALWWYNRSVRPGVDLDAFAEPYVAGLRKYLESWGWRLWALDITSDLQFPAFAAIAAPGDGSRIAVGFGCHLDGTIALGRALTELYQCFDPEDQRSLRARPGWIDFSLEQHPYLLPDENVPRRMPAAHAAPWGQDLRADVLQCVERAMRAGIELLVLDQTRPEAPLSVVKVIAPGLRHFWPRFGPGRLYEAPVRLGWLPAPHDEAALNSLPIFW